ncbi:MAG: deoxyribonuclease IV [Thermoplasmatota archaeon]|nr:deoxyribonuclease IV [Halobacteriales archaeon]
MLKLGAHNSTAGGFHNAVAEMVAIGGEATQIFCKNQRQWRAKPIEPEAAAAWRKAMQDSGRDLAHTMVHGAYLVNLGHPDADKRELSRLAFLDELRRTEQLGIPHLNFHPGSHLAEEKGLRDDKTARNAALDRIAACMSQCIDETKGAKVKLTLENAAGQGTNVGNTWAELARIVDTVADPHRVAVTVDTQHSWACGYDWLKRYDESWSEFDGALGLKWLVAFHLNDSKQPCGSRLDRHDTAGEGHLGRPFFHRLVNDRRFDGRLGILETPDGPESWKKELAWLRSLRE